MSDWYFSEADGRLICPERIVQLTPKAAAVLTCLRRHRAEVESVETFLEEVWPDAHVTPDLVREYIHDLRDALSDPARQPQYIETVRGKGFRLIGEIQATSAEHFGQGQIRERGERPTIAVLKPVTSNESDLPAIADEVASNIINHLARFHYVGVVARQSTFSSTEVTDLRAFARDVDADYLLESNFSRIGDVILARIQLVDAKTGQNLWGNRLELTGEDLLAAVDEISNTVVMALTGWHGELHRAAYKTVTLRRDAKLNAFEHFVLGCDLEMRLDADNLQRSLFHLEQSVTLDPTFARAWLVFALELRWAYSVMPGRDRSYLARAASAFETAFNLAPTDPVNLALMAMNTARTGNVASALAMLKRAETGMSGDSDAMACIATAKAVLTDDIADACAIFDTVLQANAAPPSWFYFAEAGIAFMAGQFDRCISSSRSGPQEISALVFRCLSHAMLGQEAETRATHNVLVSTFPNVDFGRFARNFPIVSTERLKNYQRAVVVLENVLAKED